MYAVAGGRVFVGDPRALSIHLVKEGKPILTAASLG